MDAYKTHIDVSAGKAALEQATGKSIPDQQSAAILGKLCASNPNLARQVAAAAQAGKVVRVRPDVLYSTVGVQLDAVTGAFPAQLPDLFARPIGDTEPTLDGGTVLNTFHTNMRDQGRIDSRKKYVVSRLGFSVFPFAEGTGGATVAERFAIANGVQRGLAAIMFTGTQTQQEWGPIKYRPLPSQSVSSVFDGLAAGVQNLEAAEVSTSQGQQAIHRLEKPMVLGAGESLRVALEMGIAPPGAAAALAGVCVAVQCVMWGYSVTEVTG